MSLAPTVNLSGAEACSSLLRDGARITVKPQALGNEVALVTVRLGPQIARASVPLTHATSLAKRCREAGGVVDLVGIPYVYQSVMATALHVGAIILVCSMMVLFIGVPSIMLGLLVLLVLVGQGTSWSPRSTLVGVSSWKIEGNFIGLTFENSLYQRLALQPWWSRKEMSRFNGLVEEGSRPLRPSLSPPTIE
jgi:hypothetical protein